MQEFFEKNGLRVTGYGLWVMGYGLQVTGYGDKNPFDPFYLWDINEQKKRARRRVLTIYNRMG